MSAKHTTRIKRAAIAILAMVIVYIVLSPMSLTKIGDRANPYVLDKGLKEKVARETEGMNEEEVLKYSVKKTASLLTFSVRNDLTKGKANCVGYAQMGAAIANYAFKLNGMDATARPVVGYVMFYGINLCNVLKWFMPNKRCENFVKDHDFVEYHIDGQTIYCDASAYDLIYKDCKTTW